MKRWCFPLVLGGVAAVASGSTSTQAAEGLVKRLFTSHARDFVFESIPRDVKGDVFEVASKGSKIVLRGNDGVSMASALNWYLKNRCHASMSWSGDQLKLPKRLPVMSKPVRIVSPHKHRYYLNYCTFNYSMSWWDWKRWEREIDWMALNGINLPLALTGEEAIWQKVYRKMGFSDADLKPFFCGPAFFSWFWMGNLDGWGGPLPQSWFDSHLKLQQKIVARERAYGMKPVLAAFSGHVPQTFTKRFPKAAVKKINWGIGFADTTLLDPTDPLFKKIGAEFLKEQTKYFGTDHYYSSDTFNENRPPSSDPTFLYNVSKSIYESMASVDPQSNWVMQGWIFHNDSNFWKQEQVKALLSGVPKGKMLVLDLYTESYPQWKAREAYFGQPWIWCMLHNFGGNQGLHGNLEDINTQPIEAKNDPASGDMQGIGLTMEAIETNYPVYELMMENTWRSNPVDVSQWLKAYARRHYGKADAQVDKAWNLLHKVAYSSMGRDVNSVVQSRPSLGSALNPSGSGIHGGSKELLEAWDLLVQAAPRFRGVTTYEYDLVDVSRQVFAEMAQPFQQEVLKAYAAKDRAALGKASSAYLGLIRDWDQLMSTRSEFLLGKWIQDARSWGKNRQESDLYEWNARGLVTLWGDKNSVLHEYSAREWGGLLKGFYLPRWAQCIAALDKSLQTGEALNPDAFETQLRNWESAWTYAHDAYPAAPTGDASVVSKALHAKYRHLFEAAFPKPIKGGLEAGKPVSASSVQDGHSAANATDGYVSLDSAWWAAHAPAWLQIDLLKPTEVGVVHVWPYWGDGRSYQYTVDVSLDGLNWETVVDQSKNVTASTASGNRFVIPATSARYVRVNMLHNSANEGVHLVEVKLYPPKK